MKSPKSVTIFFILSLGVLGSVFILKDTFDKGGDVSNSPKESVFQKATDLFGFNTKDQGTDRAKVFASNSGSNLTKDLSTTLALQIKAKNSPDKALIEIGKELPSDAMIENIVKGSLDASSGYHPKALSAKYQVSDDTSTSNQLRYLKELETIGKNDRGDFSATTIDIMKQIAEEEKGDLARQVAEIYGKTADDYAKMSVPKNWVDFHKALLSHFYSAQEVYAALSDFENDPMKSYIAAQAIPKIDKSANGISILVSDGIKENNLKF